MTLRGIIAVTLIALSLVAAGWLLMTGLSYATAAFDCDLPGVYGPDCADAASYRIAVRAAFGSLMILPLWVVTFFVVFRERRKR